MRDGRLRATTWYWRQAIGMWWWSAARHPHVSHHYPVGGPAFDLIGDLRHAARVVAKSPGQSALIVLTLAIAIGATTIGFAFADTVVLRGLPIKDPDNTVVIYAVDARDPQRRAGTYVSDIHEFRSRARSVERLSTWAQTRTTLLRRGAEAARVTVLRVTGDLFGVWEVNAQIGRTLQPDDDRPGAARVAVLTDRFWAEQFSRSHDALGESLLIDDVPHEIVGVLPPEFEFANFANLAMAVSFPIAPQPERDLRAMMVTGRLAPGATVDQAQAELATIASSLEQQHPVTNGGRRALVLLAGRAMGGPNTFLALTLIVGTAFMVTLIASINVAGVLLSRAVARQREFALRVALGAKRARVFRQLGVEGLLLALFGAAGGLVVAELGLRLIRSIDAEPLFQQVVIDSHEVAFVMLLAVLAPLLFSLAPALAALRVNLVGSLQSETSRTTGAGRRGRELLVVAQLGIAVALAIVGGLVARTAMAQLSAHDGFDKSGLVKFSLSLDASTSPASRRQVLRQVRDQLLARGATSVGMLDILPAATIETASILALDSVAATGQEAWANAIHVGETAGDTLRVPLLAGRQFTPVDIEHASPVALVSQELERRYFGGVGAVGQRITIVRGDQRASYEIVGVTADVRNTDPERRLPPRVWLPLSNPVTVNVVARFAGDVASATTAIRTVVREVAPAIPIESLETYEKAIARTRGGDQIAMGMLVSFALVAVLFAAIGLYGTVALSTSLRGAEFATRFALGANATDVARLVLRESFRLLLCGLVPGIALGVIAANAMRRLLFGVSPLDPLNIAAVVALLTLITLAATAAPVLRAARADMMSLLRRA